MTQKIIYLFYLSIGISSLIFTSCTDKQIEHKVNVTLVYINNSSYNIKYNEYIQSIDTKFFLFELSPSEEKKIIIETSGDSNLSTDNCCQGILSDYQGDNDIIIEYKISENEICKKFLSGTGSTSMNYEQFNKNEKNNFSFEISYIITDKLLNTGIECN